jgi:hypothetical protein
MRFSKWFNLGLGLADEPTHGLVGFASAPNPLLWPICKL